MKRIKRQKQQKSSDKWLSGMCLPDSPINNKSIPVRISRNYLNIDAFLT